MRVITIQSDEDVVSFAKDVRTGKRRRMDEIRIALKGVDQEQANELSREINKRYFACGCSEATAFGLAGLGAAAAWAFFEQQGWLTGGLTVAGATVVATFIGKAVGRWRARAALNETVDRLFSFAPGARDLGKGDGTARCAVGK